jgi:electron transfer flavoprotein alpha subunit
MSDIKRIDPRRAYGVTADGRRRIVLGEALQSGAAAAALEDEAVAAKTPLRTLNRPEQWLMAVVYSSRGKLDEHARQAIAAAALLANPNDGVVAIVLGELSEDIASTGADQYVVLPEHDASSFMPDRALAAVQALIDKYNPRHIFIPDKADGDGDLGRRLIAAGTVTFATHVVEINKSTVSVRWSRGGELATVPLPKIVLLEAGVADSKLPFVGRAERDEPVRTGISNDGSSAFRDLGLKAGSSGNVSLEEADFVVSGGNGVARPETLRALASELGATIGASRVAVDDGRFARDQQVGASGKTVSAQTYIAVGISGAVQHLQGIKDCRHVIAINRDANAPIVKRADLAVIGDAEEIMQAMLDGLTSQRNAAGGRPNG